MGKYTVSRQADRRVQEDMDKIKGVIIERLNPRSIILFGGFGRGEGSFEVINGKILPLNDYDMYVVSDKRIGDDIFERVGEECSGAIGRGGLEFVKHSSERYDKNKFFHVDLRCLEYSRLPKLLPTQRTAELKNSMIIYGEDVRKIIPDIEVPISDAIRLLFNKMNHLLIAKDNTREIKIIYSVKGFIDCCTALCIFYKRFKPSYTERARQIRGLDIPQELKWKVEWANKFRLSPKFNSIKNADELWQDAVEWVGFTFKHIIAKSLNLKQDDWNGIAGAVYKKLPYSYFTPYLGNKCLFPLQYYLTLRFFIEGFKYNEFLFNSLLSWRDAGIRIAIPQMLYLYGEEQEAERYLKGLTFRTKPLKERILKLFSIYYQQKLI